MVTIGALDTSFLVYPSVASWNCTILYCSTFQNRNNLVMYLFSIQVCQISDIINALWNILRIGTQLVNCLICNQQIVVSITFLIVSSLNMDILTKFGTVRLAEQINGSDYVICINVHSNSPVWYMCQAIRINIGITQWLRHSNLKCQLHTLIFICNQGAVVVVIVW
jgi:hypothetical protein